MLLTFLGYVPSVVSCCASRSLGVGCGAYPTFQIQKQGLSKSGRNQSREIGVDSPGHLNQRLHLEQLSEGFLETRMARSDLERSKQRRAMGRHDLFARGEALTIQRFPHERRRLSGAPGRRFQLLPEIIGKLMPDASSRRIHVPSPARGVPSPAMRTRIARAVSLSGMGQPEITPDLLVTGIQS